MKKILIAAPLYPPEIGGPAEYAFRLEQEFRALGYEVLVVKFADVRRYPAGFRHLVYFFKILWAVRSAEWGLVLDTFSVGLPAVAACRLSGKKTIIRTGGDFLWEFYVERTDDLVLLKNFYQTRLPRLSFKERLIFWLTGWAVRHCDRLVFSTVWQRDIWLPAYRFDPGKCTVIENYYGQKEPSLPPAEKNFLVGTRPLKWKNAVRLNAAFQKANLARAPLVYDDIIVPFQRFMDKIARCYAVVLVSLGDISPNMILDAVRFNKPFILTQETGLYARLKDAGIFVDPEDIDEIAGKLVWLADEKNYQTALRRVEQFTFTHSWGQIAREFLDLVNRL